MRMISRESYIRLSLAKVGAGPAPSNNMIRHLNSGRTLLVTRPVCLLQSTTALLFASTVLSSALVAPAALSIGAGGLIAGTSGCVLSSVRATPTVIRRLRTGDRHARQEAAMVLGSRGTEALVPLLDTVHDPDPSVRRAVAISLGDIGNPRAIKPLITLLVDEDSLVQCAAAKSLWRIGTPEARTQVVQHERTLIAYLGSAEVELREAALETLKTIDDDTSRQGIALFEEWEKTQGHEKTVEFERFWKSKVNAQ